MIRSVIDAQAPSLGTYKNRSGAQMKHSRHWGVNGLAASVLCAGSLTASAQSTANDGSRADTGDSLAKIEEVMVTARRRSEDIQIVPSTIAVVSSAALEARGVETQSDLQTVVPGLIVRVNGNQNQQNFVIRGEAMDSYSGSVPGVQPYVNEVPLSANNAVSFYDVENIQVLKGPQGTLFGRNSTGGAVLIQTKRPGATLGGYAQVQYGNYDRLITEAALDVPISADKALVRVAGTYSKGGAFVRNLYDGKKYGDNGAKSGRVTLHLTPVEKLTNTTVVELSDFDGTNAPLFPIYVVPCGGTGPGNPCRYTPTNPFFNQLINSAPGTYFPNYPNGYVFPGGMEALPAFLRSQGDYVVDAFSSGNFEHHGSSDAVQNETIFELTSALTLKNIFGYSETHGANAYANSNTPYPVLISGGNRPGGSHLEDLKTRTISDELQLQGQAFGDRLTYILGAFYVKQRDENNSPLHGVVLPAATAAPTTPIGTFNLRYHSFSEDESYAAFAQGTYAFTDKLNLTLGGRYTEDKLSIRQTPDSTLVGPDLHTTESNPSWTVSLDYHFTPELMAYVTTRGSWRVGGYNPFIAPRGNTLTAADGGTYFKPETVKDVEVGVKYNGFLGDIPFQINANAFNQWAKNAQKSASVVVAGRITSATTNAPEAEVTGVELDFQLRPATWLHLGGSASHQHARFTKDQAVVYGLNAKFGPYADSPRYSGSLYGDVIGELGEAGTLTFHADMYAQTKQYFGNLGALTPGNVIPSYKLFNARLSWADPFGMDGMTVSAFVKNIGDELYYIGGSAAAQATSLEYADFGQPRTYGIVTKYEF